MHMPHAVHAYGTGSLQTCENAHFSGLDRVRVVVIKGHVDLTTYRNALLIEKIIGDFRSQYYKTNNLAFDYKE
jgi:hypothetical protein